MFDALPLSYGGDIVDLGLGLGLVMVMVMVVLVHVLVHFSWFSVLLGSTPFNVQLDVRGTKGSPHPSFTRRGFKGGRMPPLPLL